MSLNRNSRARNVFMVWTYTKLQVARSTNNIGPVFLANYFYFCDNNNMRLFRECSENGISSPRNLDKLEIEGQYT